MEEFDNTLELYEKTFDDSFPMFSMSGTPPKEVIKIINECIEKNKDVYDLGYLTLDGDTLY